jgi:Txe/YoeB family toxin of Txe-Axe toxin-antitoxin module
MDIGTDLIGKAKEKKLDKNKQYINELNEKINNAMDELSELPYQIKEENERLMLESIGIFYERMASNKTEIKEIADWIAGIREELKKKILQKQDMEAKNNLIYTYMHDLLGVELMEVFDSEHMNRPPD